MPPVVAPPNERFLAAVRLAATQQQLAAQQQGRGVRLGPVSAQRITQQAVSPTAGIDWKSDIAGWRGQRQPAKHRGLVPTALGAVGHGLTSALDVLATPKRAIQSTVLEGVQGLMGEGFSGSDWLKQTLDPHFGGANLVKGLTGNRFLDSLAGFALDVGLDPLTYIGLGAIPGATGRAALAMRGEELGLAPEILEGITRYGPNTVRDVGIRTGLGLKPKIGLEFMGAHIPGTETLTRGLQKGVNLIREPFIDTALGRGVRKLGVSRVGATREAFETLATGKGDIGYSSRIVRALQGKQIADRVTKEGVFGDEVLAIGNLAGDNPAITHAWERGETGNPVVERLQALDRKMRGYATGEGPEAKAAGWNGKGVSIGMREHHVAHILTEEGRKVTGLRDPAFVGLGVSPTGLQYERQLVPRLDQLGNPVSYEIGGKLFAPIEGTIEEANTWSLANLGFKIYEDSPRLIAARSVEDIGRAVGNARFVQELTKPGRYIAATGPSDPYATLEQVSAKLSQEKGQALAKPVARSIELANQRLRTERGQYETLVEGARETELTRLNKIASDARGVDKKMDSFLQQSMAKLAKLGSPEKMQAELDAKWPGLIKEAEDKLGRAEVRLQRATDKLTEARTATGARQGRGFERAQQNYDAALAERRSAFDQLAHRNSVREQMRRSAAKGEGLAGQYADLQAQLEGVVAPTREQAATRVEGQARQRLQENEDLGFLATPNEAVLRERERVPAPAPAGAAQPVAPSGLGAVEQERLNFGLAQIEKLNQELESNLAQQTGLRQAGESESVAAARRVIAGKQEKIDRLALIETAATGQQQLEARNLQVVLRGDIEDIKKNLPRSLEELEARAAEIRQEVGSLQRGVQQLGAVQRGTAPTPGSPYLESLTRRLEGMRAGRPARQEELARIEEELSELERRTYRTAESKRAPEAPEPSRPYSEVPFGGSAEAEIMAQLMPQAPPFNFLPPDVAPRNQREVEQLLESVARAEHADEMFRALPVERGVRPPGGRPLTPSTAEPPFGGSADAMLATMAANQAKEDWYLQAADWEQRFRNAFPSYTETAGPTDVASGIAAEITPPKPERIPEFPPEFGAPPAPPQAPLTDIRKTRLAAEERAATAPTKATWTKERAGLYTSADGHRIEKMVLPSGRVEWTVTYPGREFPDTAFRTLKTAQAAIDEEYAATARQFTRDVGALMNVGRQDAPRIAQLQNRRLELRSYETSIEKLQSRLEQMAAQQAEHPRQQELTGALGREQAELERLRATERPGQPRTDEPPHYLKVNQDRTEAAEKELTALEARQAALESPTAGRKLAEKRSDKFVDPLTGKEVRRRPNEVIRQEIADTEREMAKVRRQTTLRWRKKGDRYESSAGHSITVEERPLATPRKVGEAYRKAHGGKLPPTEYRTKYVLRNAEGEAIGREHDTLSAAKKAIGPRHSQEQAKRTGELADKLRTLQAETRPLVLGGEPVARSKAALRRVTAQERAEVRQLIKQKKTEIELLKSERASMEANPEVFDIDYQRALGQHYGEIPAQESRVAGVEADLQAIAEGRPLPSEAPRTFERTVIPEGQRSPLDVSILGRPERIPGTSITEMKGGLPRATEGQIDDYIESITREKELGSLRGALDERNARTAALGEELQQAQAGVEGTQGARSAGFLKDAQRTLREERAGVRQGVAEELAPVQAKAAKQQAAVVKFTDELSAANQQMGGAYDSIMPVFNGAQESVYAAQTGKFASAEAVRGAEADVARVRAVTERPKGQAGLPLTQQDFESHLAGTQRALTTTTDPLTGKPVPFDIDPQTQRQLAAADIVTKTMGAVDRDITRMKGLQSALNSGSLTPVMERVARDGWQASLANMDAMVGRNLLVRQEINRMWQNYSRQLAKEKTAVGKMIEHYTKFFKAYATATPGFHLRNAMSAVFMNFTEGVSTKEMRDGLTIWRAFRKNPMGDWKAALAPELRQNADQVIEAVYASGAGGRFSAEELAKRAYGKGERVSKLYDNPFTRFSQKRGANIEGGVRSGLALHSLREDGIFQNAVARIKRVHFDYSDVNEIDEALRPYIPFWTFMSRNLPLQVQQMWLKPRAYLRYQALTRNFAYEDEEGKGPFMPDYLTRMGAFGITPGLALAPDIGPSQIQTQINMLQDPKQLLSNLNPAMKVPLELATNRDFFYGTSYRPNDLERLPPEAFPLGLLGRALGFADQTPTGTVTEKKFLNAYYDLIPTLAQINRLGTTTAGREGKGMQYWLNFLGIPIKQVGGKLEREEIERQRRRARFPSADEAHMKALREFAA